MIEQEVAACPSSASLVGAKGLDLKTRHCDRTGCEQATSDSRAIQHRLRSALHCQFVAGRTTAALFVGFPAFIRLQCLYFCPLVIYESFIPAVGLLGQEALVTGSKFLPNILVCLYVSNPGGGQQYHLRVRLPSHPSSPRQPTRRLAAGQDSRLLHHGITTVR
jgi:hypothetical protein